MTTRSVTLDVPESVYSRAEQMATVGNQRVQDVLIAELLQALDTGGPALPESEEAELAALRYLSNDALWTIARERLPQDVEARLGDLLERKGDLTDDERAETEVLIERADRLMVRRAEAAMLLSRRGITVTSKLLAS
ncbi:MAG: hypothetical protein IPM16_17490 [Chloroflexi bacterium]|nr:hypothetical protein [Chloroflexota bacterium]